MKTIKKAINQSAVLFLLIGMLNPLFSTLSFTF